MIDNQIRTYLSKMPIAPKIYRWFKKKYIQIRPQLDAREVPGIYGRVHRYDLMFTNDLDEGVKGYNQIGLEAFKLIEEAVQLVGQEVDSLGAVLDFGCGYGRVLRFLIESIDPERISVFDVDPVATSFCAYEFGVRPLTFRKKWDWQLVPLGLYDLIWVGSVLTHLSESFAIETLNIPYQILAPEGLLVFTTHDSDTLPNLREGFYGAEVQQKAAEVEEQLQREGLSFIPYTQSELNLLRFDFQRKTDFGITWIRRDYVEEMVKKISAGELILIRYKAKGWGGQQAVFMYQNSKDRL